MAVNTHSVLVDSPHVRRLEEPGSVTIDCPDATIRLDLAEGSSLRCALTRVDGRRSIRELASDTASDVTTLCRIFEHLVECGAIWDASGLVSNKDPEVQLRTYYRLCDGWAADLFQAPFWTLIMSGAAPPEVVLGWCEQFYHRTVGADEHNAIALAFCSVANLRGPLEQHFREEFGHGEIFLAGLEESGVAREQVLSRPPLRSTRQLIDYMGELGRSDTIAYLACYGVLHSPRVGQTVRRARAQFGRLAALYPFAAPAIRAVLQHAEIDLRCGHDQIILDSHIRAVGGLSRSEAVRATHAARNMVIVFDRFFAGVLEVNRAPAIAMS